MCHSVLHLLTLLYCGDDPVNSFSNGNPVILGTISVAEGYCIGFGVFATGNEYKRSLLFGCSPNFFREPIGRIINACADTLCFELIDNVVEVLVERIGHWNGNDLFWSQPCGESAGI